MKVEPALRWELLPFAKLDTSGLYEILALRQLVFVVEQTCAFLDADGKDADSLHLVGRAASRLDAYARIVPPGVIYEEPSIGRIIVHPTLRGRGFGRALAVEAMARTRELFGPRPIRIGAQARLEEFYRSLGFVPASEPYDEDGILHVEMLTRSS